MFIIILLLAFQFISVFFIGQLRASTEDNFKEQINTQVDFLVRNLSPIMTQAKNDGNIEENRQQIRQTLETFSSSAQTDIYVVNTDDTIIEVNQETLKSRVGTKSDMTSVKSVIRTERSDYVIDKQNERYYVTRPIISSEEASSMLAVVVISADMSQLNAQTRNIMDLFLKSGLVAMGVTLILAVGFSQGLTRPIENMRQQAVRISQGVYSFPAKIYGRDELGELAMTINELAQKVQEAQNSTESERQRLDGILLHMSDGVIGTDQYGNILQANDWALYLLDLRLPEVINQSIIEILGIEDQYSLRDLMLIDHEVFFNRDINGIDSIIKAEFSIIRRETGFVTGLVCVLTDITDQERTEQERRDFVSNVSHELRTPLTSIMSYSEALSAGAWKDPKIAPQFINVIESESNRMIRMIHSLLDLSKMDGGQIKLEKDFVDFKRLINFILDRTEFRIEKNGDVRYRIIREFTTRDIYVDVDRDRITQVVENLLNNAMKYSPDGSDILVRIKETHKSIIFSITDQGLGIPQQSLPHLFERFYRVDKARSREQGGTGLGLALSKEIIELHGGRIWAESIEGKGSTFSFELPYSSIESEFDDWG